MSFEKKNLGSNVKGAETNQYAFFVAKNKFSFKGHLAAVVSNKLLLLLYVKVTLDCKVRIARCYCLKTTTTLRSHYRYNLRNYKIQIPSAN